MIFDPSTASHLKPWLVRTLEPICDAEPGALADYILALLKHNVPENEMRNELAVQLDEFLEKECLAFIDTLFAALRTKSYLPYAPPSPPPSTSENASGDTGIPIPLDGFLASSSVPPARILKRSIGSNEKGEGPSAKGPRLSVEGQFSRYSNQSGSGEHQSTGGWGVPGEDVIGGGYRDDVETYGSTGGPRMSTTRGMNGRRQQGYLPPEHRRGICRDYHNHGYCARGVMCKYSHGDDAVVPGMYPMNGSLSIPFMPMFAGGNPFNFGGLNAAYDPHEARMDMQPLNRPPRAPLLPRIQQGDGLQVAHGSRVSGELPVIQDLTPAISETDAGQQQPSAQIHEVPVLPSSDQEALPLQPGGSFPDGNYFTATAGTNGEPYAIPQPPTDAVHPTEFPVPVAPKSAGRFGVSRGPRGSFGGEVHHFRPERQGDKTLVVEKIPHDQLSLEQVNEWFKRFGTVTNVAIDPSSAKALISFSTHDEALAAHRSQEAVFGNRFVKIFWHRPMDGHGQVGAKLLAASASLVASMAEKNSSEQSTAAAFKGSPVVHRTLTSTQTSVNSMAAKQQLLEKQIAEQKSLMAALDTASGEEKKAIFARLRKIGSEMKASPTDQSQVDVSTNMEEKERERLDRELETHVGSAATGEDESTEALKAKLDKLKAEAAMLGIPDSSTEIVYGGNYRPYRGRGRGSRTYRSAARGGYPQRASMKLDNRPRKLLVRGVLEDGIQTIREWFETTGQVESFVQSDSGDVVVTFKTRAGAELGLSKGSKVPIAGTVQISWYLEKPGAPPVKDPSSVVAASGEPETAMKDEGSQQYSSELGVAHSPHGHEEEVGTSGWGDGEDGMGML